MSEKCVFLDIDGTLRDHVKGVPPSAVRAVECCRAVGNKVVLCTGRTEWMIPEDVREIPVDGVIAGGGCYISCGDEVILDHEIAPEMASELMALLDGLDIQYRIEAVAGIYVDNAMTQFMELFRNEAATENSELQRMMLQENKLDRYSSLAEYRSNPVPITKICMMAPRAELGRLAELLPETVRMICHETSDPEYQNCEIIQAGYDKGSAVFFYCTHLEIPEAATIGFGDSMNDLDMFRACGMGVAMGNAQKPLREAADFVCGSLLEDGLYNAFAELGLME
jgi:hypothetical protein